MCSWLMFVVPVFAADPAPTPIPARVEARLDAALERVEATPAQREAAHARLDEAVAEVHALRVQGQGVREQVRDALFGASVDRAALEDARRSLLDLVDAGSALLFDAGADLADLFTAEQRAELRQLREETARDRVLRWWRG